MVGLHGVSGWVLTLGLVLGGFTHGSESVDSGHVKASRFDTVTATRSLGYVDVTNSLLQPERGPYPEKLIPQNSTANIANDRGSILKAGQALTSGEFLQSPNHQLDLVMTANGQLELNRGKRVLWTAHTAGHPGAALSMRTSGNLVVQVGTRELWTSNTSGFPGAYLQLLNDTNLVIYASGHPVWDWGSGYIGDELNGWTLQPGAYLLSPNHEYELIMQRDGNLVLYQGAVSCPTASCRGDALWSTSTYGGSGTSLTMQLADGNLVEYDNGKAVWSSGTAGFPGAYLVLQNDNNLVIYASGHPVWDWGSGYLGNELNGWTLQPGAYLLSPNHEYELIMQHDGNLVLYQGAVSCPTASCTGDVLWNSGTDGDVGTSLTMQLADGNLVEYDNGKAVWSSGTGGFPGAYLQLQNDSNLVIYSSGHPVWDWGSGYIGDELNGWTLQPGAYLLSPNHEYELIMQRDGNLVLYQGAVSCPTASCSGDALWSTGTYGDIGTSLTMQLADGNLVAYDNGKAVWNSGTGGFPGAYLVLQNDNNLVIYHTGTAVWDWSSGLLTGATDWAGPSFCSSHYDQPYLLNSFDGVAACGTEYGDDGNSNEQGPIQYNGVEFDSVGFQCVELVMRYMYYDFGILPYSANGNTVVSNYRGDVLVKETDPAADGLPSIGDILSFGGTSSNPYGHTAIVIGVSSTKLTTLNENDSASGLDSVPVTNGVVGGGVTGWLHNPN